MSNTKVDSLLATISIDGFEYDKFQITVLMDNQVIMTMVLPGRHYQGHFINISYLYRNQSTKEEIGHCLAESKLKK